MNRAFSVALLVTALLVGARRLRPEHDPGHRHTDADGG